MQDSTVYVYIHAKIDGAKYGCLIGRTGGQVDDTRRNYTISVSKDKDIYISWSETRSFAVQALRCWWNVDHDVMVCDFGDDKLAKRVYLADIGVGESIVDKIHKISEHEKLDISELNFWNAQLLMMLGAFKKTNCKERRKR